MKYRSQLVWRELVAPLALGAATTGLVLQYGDILSSRLGLASILLLSGAFVVGAMIELAIRDLWDAWRAND